jgi:single-stranded-DNA-specific exonuclease
MQCRLVNKNFRNNYLDNLLKARGIEDLEEFYNPTITSLQSPFDLENMNEGVELYLKSIQSGDPIAIVQDCDCDGITSASIIYMYTKKLNPNIQIHTLIHEHKQHGLSDKIEEILALTPRPTLVIMPDASSNDFEYHEKLGANGIKVLVLDHHEADCKFSDNAIIINNQLSPKYKNKSLTGAGVAFQFCRAIDSEMHIEEAWNFIDLAALGICGDMGSILEPENRFITSYGFDHIYNTFFQALIDKQAYSMGEEVNYISVAFYIVPMLNAMIRVGSQEEKERMLLAFIDGGRRVPSNKRGAKGAMEYVAIESVRECTNAKNAQDRIKTKAVENLEMRIQKEGLLENKVLFIQLGEDDDFPAELNGLIATQLAARHKKPTIIARLGHDNELKGSLRGVNNSALTDFKGFLSKSGLFTYAEGHAQAAGCGIKASDLEEFIEYSNRELADYDFGESYYDINFERDVNSSDLRDLIVDLCIVDGVWGQFNPEPLIHITGLMTKANQYQIIGKNKDTLKIERNGITYIKFHANDLIDELRLYPEAEIEIIGKPNLNEWCGNITPQIMIEAYEIKDSLYSF